MVDVSVEGGLTALAARYLRAQLDGDRQKAVQVLIDQGLGSGVPPTDLLLRVVTPAQREIGRLWERNEVSVADEHVATAISQLAMSHLYSRAAPTALRREHVLIACVEGEWHDMGARVAADVLEHHGFSVCLLGPSVPLADLVARIRLEAPDVVLLSVTMPAHLDSLRHTCAELAVTFPDLSVLVGGRAAAAGGGTATSCRSVVRADRAAVCGEIVRLLRA